MSFKTLWCFKNKLRFFFKAICTFDIFFYVAHFRYFANSFFQILFFIMSKLNKIQFRRKYSFYLKNIITNNNR